jgi:hypothetical protein
MVPESIRRDPELLWSRRLIWLYFWAWLLEGAVLKWVLPVVSMSHEWVVITKNLLYFGKDIILITVYALLASRKHLPQSGFLIAAGILAALLAADAQFCGHGDWIVTLNGLRVNFLHVPLIFAIPELFSLDDVILIGQSILWLSIPMSGMVVSEFFAPAGLLRPSGFFTTSEGLICFLSLQAVFIAEGFLSNRDRIIGTLSLAALIFSLICSQNASGAVSCVTILMVFLWGLLLNSKPFKRGLVFLLVMVVVIIAASSTTVFKQAYDALQKTSPQIEKKVLPSSLWQQFQNNLAEPYEVIKVVSIPGSGTGAGTAIGCKLLPPVGIFNLTMNEWSRLLWESGLILGIAMIIWRITLAGYLIYWGVRCLKKSDNFLPWLLCAATVPLVLFGNWDHPTLLAATSLGSGLILSSTRKSYENHPVFKYAYTSVKR